MNARAANPLTCDMVYVLAGLCGVLLLVSSYFWHKESVQHDGGFPAVMLEELPESDGTVGRLAKLLADQNREAHQAVKEELGVTRSLAWVKERSPEKFIVPSSWFQEVASSNDIPTHRIEALMREAQEKPISTDDAANWLFYTNIEMKALPRKVSSPSEDQRAGVQSLQETLERRTRGAQ